MDIGINDNIAGVLAAIIGLGLALRAGVGPVVMYLTEAIKDAFEPPAGYGGLISVIVGMVLGVAVGALTAILTTGTDIWTYAAFGALGGLFMASGAIEAHKAAGAVNTQASLAIQTGKNIAAEALSSAEARKLRATQPINLEPIQGTQMAFVNYGTNEDDYRDAEAETWASGWDWESARQDSGHGQSWNEEVPPVNTETPSAEYRGLGHPHDLATD